MGRPRLFVSTSVRDELTGWSRGSFKPWHEASELAEQLRDWFSEDVRVIPDNALHEIGKRVKRAVGSNNIETLRAALVAIDAILDGAG